MRIARSFRSVRLQKALRIATLAGTAAILAACNTSDRAGTYSSTGAGVTAAGPVPHGGGYELANQRPYTIRGVTYVPTEDPNYSRTGVASWYGTDFHGELTANGERYDMTALTAAHKTLPLPSYVRVTNLDNGASIVVRVNDRGPFVDDRIIDMSAQAANLLGFYDRGVADVRVDYIGRAPLEGDDTQMLMATYSPPGGASNTAIAYNEQTRTVSAAPDTGPLRRAFNPFQNGAAAAVFEPTALPAGQDPLAALAAAPTAQGYAETPRLSPAQEALRDIATATPATAGNVLIQVGVFGDRTNVDRIAGLLGRFGSVSITDIPGIDRTLWSVRLSVPSGGAQEAVAAAVQAGATGAHVL
ncbi:MAG: septal ring lytic transglycosylase RlpA family protein [Bauldia sp.]